jgi:hypothetical protein
MRVKIPKEKKKMELSTQPKEKNATNNDTRLF